MNTNELRAEIVRNGMNLGDFARAMGVTNNTITNKLKNPSSFTIIDIQKTIEILNLDGERVIDIFFTPKVS